MKVAVIPARGGSKRIPRKNAKEFCGRPIIVWSIDAALESGCFDRVIVSTDDKEIASISRSAGAEVPFMRPVELSDDYTGTIAVIGHAIEWLQDAGTVPSIACCIYATAPFVHAVDIRRGLVSLTASECDYAFSVTSYPFPIQRAVRINERGRIEMLLPEHMSTRSQDLEVVYHDAAQFYWGRADAWLAGRPIFSSAAVPVIIPPHRVQDIDTPEDWSRAEWMYKAMQVASPQL